jgi:glutamate dehydrogenase/leucine dehydrogenase
MTQKAAMADLHHGGGKTVVALEAASAVEMTGPRRPELLADIADLLESFGGRYITGPDIGSSPQDMTAIGRGSTRALCRPESAGGSGDSSGPTAAGVIASIHAIRQHLFPGRSLESLTISVLGLGHVGTLVGQNLAAAGARLVASDVDAGRRGTALGWGATWTGPDEALIADVDIVVPCAVGGILTPDIVPTLRCRAIVGPANNQVDTDATADLLHEAGICWAPDTVVSAGGIVSAVARELQNLTSAEAAQEVAKIGDRLRDILDTASTADEPPLAEVHRRTEQLLAPPDEFVVQLPGEGNGQASERQSSWPIGM